jgi:transposase-like protein
MAATPSIDLSGWFDEQLAGASPDLLRDMIKTFAEALMGADADAVCGAEYRARSAERTNSRNGYRGREWDTRAGTIEVAIPKLRAGSYFPDWLLERRRRAEQALVTVVATAYLLGVSTRRMERLVETLGITRLSKSQVSVMFNEYALRAAVLSLPPYAHSRSLLEVLSHMKARRKTDVLLITVKGVELQAVKSVLGILPREAGEEGPRGSRLWRSKIRVQSTEGQLDVICSDGWRGKEL